jgi:hypothetical protein
MSSDTKKNAPGSARPTEPAKVRARASRSDAAPNGARHHEWRRLSRAPAPTLDELKNALRKLHKTDS